MTLFRERPELLSPFRAGDSRALETVYWHYVERVEGILRYGFHSAGAHRRVSGASPSDLRDLLQEVFIRAFSAKARASFDGVREFGPYLNTIARHVLADWGRKRGQLVLVEQIPPQWEPGTDAADDGLGDEDPGVLRVVEDYIAGLSPELRAIHHQRYELSQSQEAAAEALQISRQQVRTLESHLRKGLARALLRAELGSTTNKSTNS